MADTQAQAIVNTALELTRTHPNAPAIEILDLAMQGHEGSDLNFEVWGRPFGDWTDACSPFGELLRRAFTGRRADRLAAAQLASGDPTDLADMASSNWQADVIDPFARRYRLWGGAAPT